MNAPSAAPLPPVTRPKRWPPLFAAALALGVCAAKGFGVAAWFASGAVLAGFFLGRRIRHAWSGLALAAAVGAALVVRPTGARAATAIFLALTGAWWVLRFRDDRAPVNALVSLAAFAALGWLLAR